MRIDQFLVKSNICSRSEAKKIIKKGRVRVNDEVAGDPALHIDEKTDTVCLDGNAIVYEKYRYYMLNKPAGCVSATKDGLSETVLECLKGENTEDLFPVGRLDKDTRGLLLITNDGKLAHNLLSPKHHVDKVYLAGVDDLLSDEECKRFAEGLDIGDDKNTLPAEICRDEGCTDESDFVTYRVTLREGRFHQVKRMFEALGRKVISLQRIAMGPVALDDKLAEGEYRKLTLAEIDALKCKVFLDK